MGIQGSLNSVYVLNFHNKKLKKNNKGIQVFAQM